MKTVPVKIAVLLSAAVTVIFRFLLYKYDTVFTPETVGGLRAASYVAAAALLCFGVIWAVTEKKK